MTKKNYSDEEFEALLGSYDYKFKKGDLVKGTVCGYTSDGALVDIGAKTSATVSTREAVSDKTKNIESVLEKGQEYEFLIISDEDIDGKMQLSSLRVQQAYTWKELEKLKEANETILGEISAIVRGGLIVDILGIKGFVPSSQIKNRDQQFEIGSKIELKILTLDSQQNSFILSNKKVYSEANEEEKENLFSQIKVGQILKGDVVRITDFGAFVDINGIDGLLPISEISWQRIKHPSDVLTLGDTIEVKIIKIDTDLKRISLSLKRMSENPWLQIEGQFEEGQVIKGTVNKVVSFGAFINIFPGVEALLPVAEISDENVNPFNMFKVGDEIEVLIKKFTPQEHRIALSIKDIKK